MSDEAPKKKTGISAVTARLDKLEKDFAELSWYHAELAAKHGQMLQIITQAAAQQMAEQLRPQVDDAIQQRLQAQLADALTGSGGNNGAAGLLGL